MQKVTQYAKKL